ncbi:MAG: DUF5666 domain-containing protein [Lysobacter sp.]
MNVDRKTRFPDGRKPRPFAVLRWLAFAFASLLLTGCVSGYGGGSGNGYGDRYGGGYSGYNSQRVLGTVQDIDTRYGRIVLSTDDRYGNRGSQVAVRFDRNTRLFYQGREQAVTGLERGDGVSVDVVRSNGELWARQIEVVRNVRDSYGGGNYGGDLRGAVSFVDPRAQIIGITNGGYDARREQVRYDSRTVVEYRGQRVRPEQLESGDTVSIQARRSGNGWLAERIRVERSVREY